MHDIIRLKPQRVLVRATNWIGDAIMTTPAVRTIRDNLPSAHIALLAHPWVADVFAASPHVDEIIHYHKKGCHQGLRGMWRLAGELRAHRFDLAILLQNAFEAAFIARLAGIPARAGYTTDGRGPLLTHGVRLRAETKKRHQVFYYQEMLRGLGLTPGSNELFLKLPADAEAWAERFVSERAGDRPVIGLNPGAAYGPAKCWPAERYAELAARLHREHNALIPVFGTTSERAVAAAIRKAAPEAAVDLAGQTNLAQAMALIGRCWAFVTNDSGLMHVGAALKTPLVAIFGSTDAVATGPYADNAVVIQKELDCRPCLKTHCKADFRCMTEITVAEVFEAVTGAMEAGEKP